MTTAIPLMTETELSDLGRSQPESGFGALETVRGRLPLRALQVEARLAALTGRVMVHQTFSNPFDEPLEATYIFPLPDRAAVTEFRMEVAGRLIEGLLKERAEARREYDEAIAAGHRAAITEEERPNTFTLRVGNLMPGEEAVVHLVLVSPLPYCEGEVTFRFPLVVAPRYIPGGALEGESVGDGVEPDTDAVPDASRITPPVLLPGFPNPVRLALRVDLDESARPVHELRSSLHAVDETRAGPESVRRLAIRPGERLNRDFILRYRLAEEDVTSSLELVPDDQGDQGTYRLTLVPPAAADAGRRPRDVIFVLDRSGSMGGWKMVSARRAVGRMVDTLTERDRFTVYAFDNTLETPPSFSGADLVEASDRNRFRAIEFLARLDARGGTEMAGPLERAAGCLAGGYEDRRRLLVLVTDGQVGNEDQILKGLSKRLKNVRIFTLGIDRAVNTGFLRRLAALGAGACELVESEDRLDEVMDRIHRRIDTPVLTELSVHAEGLETLPDTQVPGRIPDLFAGAPLVVTGRFRGRPVGSLNARGLDEAGEAWSADVHGRGSDDGTVAPQWARARIRQLEDAYLIGGGDRAELERRIVETSLEFGVLSRFTAFIALDRSEVVNDGGEGRRVTQPVESPDGWALFDTAGAGMPAPAPAMSLAVAAGPVLASAVAPQMWAEAAAPMDARMSRMGSGPLSQALSAAKSLLSRGGKAPVERAKRAASPKSRAAAEPDVLAPVDLAPYRERAHELLTDLESLAEGSVARRVRALGKLSVGLRALVHDLESVGGPKDVVAALRRLLERLDALRGAQPTGTEVDTAWTAAHEALADLVKGKLGAPSTAKGAERGSFWK